MIDICDCGAKSLGFKPGGAGHSRWCSSLGSAPSPTSVYTRKLTNWTILNTDGVPDSQGDVFDGNSTFLYPPTVDIVGAIGLPPLGQAILTRASSAIVADIELFAEVHGFLCIEGLVTEKQGSLIKKAQIARLCIDPNCNADPRIKKI